MPTPNYARLVTERIEWLRSREGGLNVTFVPPDQTDSGRPRLRLDLPEGRQVFYQFPDLQGCAYWLAGCIVGTEQANRRVRGQ